MQKVIDYPHRNTTEFRQLNTLQYVPPTLVDKLGMAELVDSKYKKFRTV